MREIIQHLGVQTDCNKYMSIHFHRFWLKLLVPIRFRQQKAAAATLCQHGAYQPSRGSCDPQCQPCAPSSGWFGNLGSPLVFIEALVNWFATAMFPLLLCWVEFAKLITSLKFDGFINQSFLKWWNACGEARWWGPRLLYLRRTGITGGEVQVPGTIRTDNRHSNSTDVYGELGPLNITLSSVVIIWSGWYRI